MKLLNNSISLTFMNIVWIVRLQSRGQPRAKDIATSFLEYWWELMTFNVIEIFGNYPYSIKIKQFCHKTFHNSLSISLAPQSYNHPWISISLNWINSSILFNVTIFKNKDYIELNQVSWTQNVRDQFNRQDWISILTTMSTINYYMQVTQKSSAFE